MDQDNQDGTVTGSADHPVDPSNAVDPVSPDHAVDAVSEKLRRAMAALGEPHRFQLAVLMLPGPRPVGDLVRLTGWPQPLVSHHLAALHRSGLAEVVRDGRRRLYGLARPAEPGLRALLDLFRATPAARAGPDTAEEPVRSRPEIEDFLL